MLFFSKIFSFIQNSVKQVGKAASQMRLDKIASAFMNGMAFAVTGEHMDALGKNISNSMGGR